MQFLYKTKNTKKVGIARIAKLEEMLADKVQVAPGMEPAYAAYRTLLQKELENAKENSTS